ncbi:sensor histidine kinase [Lentibacillus sp. Marseille-P4043]|uniref:sensor histidine kinase n=1 Tax=Lentibacillus sp. Marseille-P4043 TaxID=2040293 RepID=UPI000D0B589B|nr:HAMP domain-containing sensor histidine kinase [Lentibacillus sp. Marseille-P4043]
MKPFLRDHLSFITLYIITMICLPIVIHLLDDFRNHYAYFIFLATILLAILLLFRYIRRKKMYAHLNGKGETSDLLIHHPQAPVEKAYAKQMRFIQSLFLTKEDEHKDFLHEQQLMISQTVHQMKTPLSVIQLLIQTNQLKEPSLFQEWQKIKKECDKVNFSLNQLLTYSRSSQLLADLKIEPISLKNIVQEVANDLKDYFIEMEVYPKSTIEENIIIYSDRKWLRVVIYQLLSNAAKYGEKKSFVLIRYENSSQLWIKNKGETIPESEINRVFDLFYTGTKGRIQGEATGIGLYLVKKILSTLNHPYKLSSAHNETIFEIDFSRE